MNLLFRLFKPSFGLGILGTLAAGLGGALGAFGLSKLRKKPKEQSIAEINIPQLTDFPTGSALNEQILARLRGEGIGFPQETLQAATSPFVAQLQADFPEVQRDIEAAASARGLGRSTAVVRDIGRAQAQQKRDINQIIAQAQLENLQQRKADEARAQNLALQFSGQEAGLGTTQEQMNLQRALGQAGLNQQLFQQQQQQRDLEIGLPLSIGGQILSSSADPTLSAIGGAFGDFGGTIGSANNVDSLRKIIELATAAKRAKPFRVGTPPIFGASGGFGGQL